MPENQPIIAVTSIREDKQLWVRHTSFVTKNDKEVMKHHRHVLEPGGSLIGQDPIVVSEAEKHWTPKVISDFAIEKAARIAPR